MMDAKTLYQQGITAIRDQGDLQRGRELLLQSLRQNSQNDMAWLWLTRTVQNRQKQLEYVERALSINPNNESAQQLRLRLQVASPLVATEPAPRGYLAVVTPPTVDVPVTSQERDRIAALMERAEQFLASGETEAAIEQWIAVLNLRVDHETALRNATGYLWRLSYRDDARELVHRALDAGSQSPSIYMTAIDIAERLGEHDHADELRERVASLSQAGDQLLITLADDYIQRYRMEEALAFLDRALQSHPSNQKLLVKMGDLLRQLDRSPEAATYYERAIRSGPRTADGKAADQKLALFVPVLTDRERGSVWLALRETLGVGMLLLAMGWQDAGLDLLQMGPRRWFGVALGLIGGYLMVTATSSPQQRRVADWLGGKVPPLPPGLNRPHNAPGRALEEPTQLPILSADMRYLLGTLGGILILLAVFLVFHHTFNLLVPGG